MLIRYPVLLLLARITLIAAFLLIWQFSADRFVSKMFISSPLDVITTLAEWLREGRLTQHATITAVEAFLGFALGGTAGVVAGVLLGRNPTLSALADPFIGAFYCLPKVALAPLFILWLGIDLQMKVVLTATIVFFLVFTNTLTGVREVNSELTMIIRLMGARERHLLTKVVLPSALVWVIVGLRLSVPYALIGAVVGEMVAANRGLGYLMMDSSAQFNTAGVFASLVAVMALALILNGIVKLIEHFALPWRREVRHAGATV